MVDRRLRYLIVIVLILIPSMYALTVARSAPLQGPDLLAFGWVPNGAMLGSMGPFYGSVTIQNLEAETIALRVGPGGLGKPFVSRTLPPYGVVHLSASEIGVSDPGGAVIASAVKPDSRRARIAGTVKMSAPVPAPAGVTSESHEMVDGYTGDTNYEFSPAVVLPIVQTNSGWNTIVRASLLTVDGLPGGEVRVTLHPAAGGSPLTFTQTANDGETASFDLRELGVPDGFVGSAYVESVTSEYFRVHAVAERYKASTNMLIINRATSQEWCAQSQFAPLVFSDYNFWNTGISIANVSNQTNLVTITTFTRDGAVSDVTTRTIPPNGMDFIYSPAAGTGPGFLGAARISGTQPLCAVVDEVKYTGDQPDVGHAMSYQASSLTAYVGEALVLPLVQKGSTSTGLGDTSGVQVYNPSIDNVAFTLNVRSQSGESMLTGTYGLQPGESLTLYTMGLTLNDGFQGSLWLEPTNGNGQIIAVSNNVNYGVGYDGSSSFGLVFVP